MGEVESFDLAEFANRVRTFLDGPHVSVQITERLGSVNLALYDEDGNEMSVGTYDEVTIRPAGTHPDWGQMVWVNGTVMSALAKSVAAWIIGMNAV